MRLRLRVAIIREICSCPFNKSTFSLTKKTIRDGKLQCALLESLSHVDASLTRALATYDATNDDYSLRVYV